MTEALRELHLQELLDPSDFTRLGESLAILLGTPVAFSDAQQQLLWGQLPAQTESAALFVELEPLGYLHAPVASAALNAAATLVNQTLKARWRYLASSALHDDIVVEDYEALQASELRYKTLSEELEQRVQEQIKTLDARQRQLYESERFAAIGQLAAGIAHEINTPMGFMRSNLNTLNRYLSTFDQLKTLASGLGDFWQKNEMDYLLQDSHDLLADCIAGSERVEKIVRDLRGFSSMDNPEMDFSDPSECLQRALSMINMQKPAVVEIESEINPLPVMPCQAGLLSQAFLNILQNAVQAVEYGGHIQVLCQQDDQGAFIRIHDDGAGIDPAHLSRIFEPFFTTRAVGSGTGLGLTVARDAIEAHGGSISIESSEDQGTNVLIRLPI